MLKMTQQRPAVKTKEEWAAVFAGAKHGHVLWDGNAPDPTNPAHAYTSAHHFVSHAKCFGFFRDGGRILDLGCGNSRFGIVFSEMDVEYEGVEPMAECVEFAKAAFGDYGHMRFHHTPVNSPDYGLSGGVDPVHFKLDYPDEHFTDLIAYSVFTHLQTVPVAYNYMNEIRRVLRPGGKLFISWYRSPPDKKADPYIGRSVYNEWDIMNMMWGFSFDCTYGGHTGLYYDQWGMFCTRVRG